MLFRKGKKKWFLLGGKKKPESKAELSEEERKRLELERAEREHREYDAWFYNDSHQRLILLDNLSGDLNGNGINDYYEEDADGNGWNDQWEQ